MTQHIEPVCWTSEEQIQKTQADPGHNMLIWGEPLVHHPDVALVRLSDAQAALAAAEERGRSEERERCAALIDGMIRETGWAKHNWARLALTVAVRTVRRGRQLSCREKLENVKAFCGIK